jgi:hypothetical protein
MDDLVKNTGIKSGNGWTWHHESFEPATGKMKMQLVPTNINKVFTHSGGFSQYLDFAENVLADTKKAKAISPELAHALQNSMDNKYSAERLAGRVKGTIMGNILGNNPDDVIRSQAKKYSDAIRTAGVNASLEVTTYRTKAGLLRASVRIVGKGLAVLGIAVATRHAVAGEFEEAGKSLAPPVGEVLSITVLPLGEQIMRGLRVGDPIHHQEWASNMGVDPKGLDWGNPSHWGLD